jgi:hypothetical protein
VELFHCVFGSRAKLAPTMSTALYVDGMRIELPVQKRGCENLTLIYKVSLCPTISILFRFVLKVFGVGRRLQGQYAAALTLQQRSLRIREATLGPLHADVATGLNNLADLTLKTGAGQQAVALYVAPHPALTSPWPSLRVVLRGPCV